MKNKKSWYFFRFVYFLATVIVSFFDRILSHFDANWRVIRNGSITRQGVIFLSSWIIVTFGFFIFEFFKNKELENKDKKIHRLNEIFEGIGEVSLNTVNDLVDHLDKNFERKSLLKVVSTPRKQLREMVNQIEERVKLFFGYSPREITTKTSLAYRSKYLDNGKWRSLAISNNIRTFSPEKYYEDKQSAFFRATQEETLVFNPKGDKTKGSILCYGFGVASEKHEALIYIEAVLSISTKYKPFVRNKRKKDIIEIKESLELNVFDHYVDKLKIELINFLIDRTNEMLKGCYKTTILQEAQLLHELGSKKNELEEATDKINKLKFKITKVFEFLKTAK